MVILLSYRRIYMNWKAIVVDAQGLHPHDKHMMFRTARFLLIIVFFSAVIPATAAEVGQIVISEIEYEDYVRNPRMEEEDRLTGNVFTFKPGLEIIADEDEVEIRFFEERIGVTPWEQDDMPPGAYRVRLERTGFEIMEFWVTVRNDRRTVVLVSMGKTPGTLVLDNLPPGAEVTIDRNPVEGNEISTTAGTRSLRVSAFGWDSVQATIEIPPGQSIEWRYDGQRTSFALQALKIRPTTLPSDDRRGFNVQWSASSGGSADVRVFGPEGNQVAVIPFAVSSARGTVNWKPGTRTAETLPDGEYRIVAAGTGYDSTSASTESSVILDSRFQREPRPVYAPLPGLLYAPGSAMLPRGIWQASTAAGVDIGTGNSDSSDGVPIIVGVRFSPAARWEFGGKFGITARDPFDTTSIGMGFSGSWRATPKVGPYSLNLAILFSYGGYAADFGRSPAVNPGMALPGLQFTSPMELALGNWNLILSPSIYLTFLGDTPGEWYFAGPARMVGSLGTGIYYEDGHFLVGFSAAARTPDYPNEYLDWTIWGGLEGRIDLPGDASYLAIFSGIRTLDADPVVSVGIEFGVIR
jgi:hypothetical protein